MQVNHSILINWRDDGKLGCSKNCFYCNWRADENLSSFCLPDDKAIIDFVSHSEKSTVTISGGGDPLYEFDKNKNKLFHLIDLIKSVGRKVRIVTREFSQMDLVINEIDEVSISLDDEVMPHVEEINSICGDKVKYSIVMPPYPIDKLKGLMGYYIDLYKKLKRPLALRENLNSVFETDLLNLCMTGTDELLFIPKWICYNGVYLTNRRYKGYEIFYNRLNIIKALLRFNTLDTLFIYGGFIKHILTGGETDYSDIDIVTDNPHITNWLVTLGFKIIKHNSPYPTPKYLSAIKNSIVLHIAVVGSRSEAIEYLQANQLEVDRIYLTDKGFYSAEDPESLLEAFDFKASPTLPICSELKSKVLKSAYVSDDNRFKASKDIAYKDYIYKLTKRGFTILPSQKEVYNELSTIN